LSLSKPTAFDKLRLRYPRNFEKILKKNFLAVLVLPIDLQLIYGTGHWRFYCRRRQCGAILATRITGLHAL
jgi:hypothetical protein